MKKDRADKFTVLEAQIADAQQIAALHHRTWTHANQNVRADTVAAFSISERERHWTNRLSLEHGMDYFALVAKTLDDSRILGFADAGASRDHDKRGFGELYELSIDPECKGTDVARALVANVIDRLKDASFIGAHLSIANSYASRSALYQALGWRIERAQRDHAGSGRSTTETRFETTWAFSSPK